MNTQKILGYGARNLLCALAVILALAFTACETEPEPEHVHQWEWTVTTPATCVAPGEEAGVCTLNSSHTTTRSIDIDPNAHDYQWTVITPATRTEGGEEKGVCSHDPSHTTTRDISNLTHYTITGSGTTFTATAGGKTITNGTGAIADVITAIRADGNGEAVTVQFGDGTGTLDIGGASAMFNNLGGGTWGAITLTGKITSANWDGYDKGTVNIGNGVSINSTADIANTTTTYGSMAIYIIQSGNNTVNTIISGGTVSGVSLAVWIQSGSYITTSGSITISGTAMVTNDSLHETIYNVKSSVIITGGTVQNTANGPTISSWGDTYVGATVTLGGNPEINGQILLKENATLKLSSDPQFNPGNKVYTLDFDSTAGYTADRVAVTGGANFINNFALPSTVTAWKLAANNDDDLVLASNP